MKINRNRKIPLRRWENVEARGTQKLVIVFLNSAVKDLTNKKDRVDIIFSFATWSAVIQQRRQRRRQRPLDSIITKLTAKIAFLLTALHKFFYQ